MTPDPATTAGGANSPEEHLTIGQFDDGSEGLEADERSPEQIAAEDAARQASPGDTPPEDRTDEALADEREAREE